MGTYIYNLNTGDSSDKSFYQILSDTTSDLLDMFHSDPSVVHVKEFHEFIKSRKIENQRSINEYIIEYIMIGLFWKKYAQYAPGLSKSLKNISNALYTFRNQSEQLKGPVDKLRGKIASKFLLKKDNSYELLPIIENFERLTDWLDATKYFKHELNRLANWHIFLQEKSPIYISSFLNNNKEITERFFNIAKSKLSNYTQGVNSFVSKTKRTHKDREDIIFCSRSEDEYFFNMIASEILNRSSKSEFDKKSRKIVLLPACISSPKSGSCPALSTNDYNIHCKGCSAGCSVNQIRKKVEKNGMEVILIPENMKLSKSLEQWQNNPDVGIVGVACVLKVLSIGYQISSTGLASQSVFLDYCGCPKHWAGQNKHTDLDTVELYKTLNIPCKAESISNLQMVLC